MFDQESNLIGFNRWDIESDLDLWIYLPNMLPRFSKNIALFLSTWIFVTSIGLSIDVHFCNGNVYSVGINANADKCSQFVDDSDDCTGSTIKGRSCCDHTSSYFHNDIDCTVADVAIQHDFSSVLVSNCAVQEFHEYCFSPLKINEHYGPPDIKKNILLSISVLRI